MIYLYVKKCPHCGLQYFGKTTTEGVYYHGSGKYWKYHLKHHNVIPETPQVWSFGSQEEATTFALEFSNSNNIVESKDWANLIPENAMSGNIKGQKYSEETKKKMSISGKGKIISKETREKISEAHTGKTLSTSTRQKISDALKGKKSHLKGKKSHKDLERYFRNPDTWI